MKYDIIGTPLPVVTCTLDKGESMITESGSMCWMSPNIKMETISNGGMGKVFGRMFSGENLFQNKFTAQGGPGFISFASSFPGCIKVFDISRNSGIVVQKSAFLAAECNVELSIHFQKKIGAGFFGGEGFIMQQLSGEGKAFIEIDGYIVEKELGNGEKIVVDTGYLAAMDETCSIDIQSVPGIKNMVFGGEGIFNTIITGPGKIYLQTMPISNVAGCIQHYIPSSN